MESPKPLWLRIVACIQYFFVVSCKHETKIPLTDLAFALSLAREILAIHNVSSGYYCDAYGNCYWRSPNYMHKRYYNFYADPVAVMYFTTFAV